METIVKAFGIGVLVILAVSALAFLSGTIVYFIWPVVAVAKFHAPELTWWESVCLCWLSGILLKPSSTSSK